ncbi:unnamed protein product [Urochloa humidicola]
MSGSSLSPSPLSSLRVWHCVSSDPSLTLSFPTTEAHGPLHGRTTYSRRYVMECGLTAQDLKSFRRSTIRLPEHLSKLLHLPVLNSNSSPPPSISSLPPQHLPLPSSHSSASSLGPATSALHFFHHCQLRGGAVKSTPCLTCR